MHAFVICGWCGSKDTDAEFVDNGVGMQQVSAATCGNCGATQVGPYDEGEIDPEDKKRGWHAGHESSNIAARATRFDGPSIYASDFVNGETMLIQYQGTVHQAFKRLSFSAPTFQMLCGLEVEVADRPPVDAITCFECIAYDAKGRP
jgi:hypothetical protein